MGGYVEVQRQDDDGEDEGDAENISVDYIPSLYVSADINDQLVYRTRTKHISNTPTYNSSTETYIRDWRLATLNLSVWDIRKKSDDCLVGVASVKLSEIFHESSSVVKFYDLKGGEGTGRIRVSMIFRSMKMKLEESLLGYSVGSFVFSSPIVAKGDMYTSKINIRAAGSRRAIKSGSSSDGGHSWTLDKPKNHPSQPSLLESGRHRIRGVWLDREDWRPSWKEQTLRRPLAPQASRQQRSHLHAPNLEDQQQGSTSPERGRLPRRHHDTRQSRRGNLRRQVQGRNRRGPRGVPGWA